MINVTATGDNIFRVKIFIHQIFNTNWTHEIHHLLQSIEMYISSKSIKLCRQIEPAVVFVALIFFWATEFNAFDLRHKHSAWKSGPLRVFGIKTQIVNTMNSDKCSWNRIFTIWIKPSKYFCCKQKSDVSLTFKFELFKENGDTEWQIKSAQFWMCECTHWRLLTNLAFVRCFCSVSFVVLNTCRIFSIRYFVYILVRFLWSVQYSCSC